MPSVAGDTDCEVVNIDAGAFADVTPTDPPQYKQQQLGARFMRPARTDQDRFERHVAYFIAMTCSPYAIVENDGFKELIKFALPGYHLPCRTTFSTSRIPALYARTKDTIRERLRSAEYVALTTDCWTAHNKSQFISLTCSFVDTDWMLRNVTLACRELNTSHTAKNVSDALKNIIAEYAISTAQVTAITTDRAANMIAAVKDLKLNHVACFAHAMNTIIHKMLDHKFIQPVLEKAKNIYSLFAYSPQAHRALTESQTKLKLPKLKMPSSCKTRWWSELAQMKLESGTWSFDLGQYGPQSVEDRLRSSGEVRDDSDGAGKRDRDHWLAHIANVGHSTLNLDGNRAGGREGR